MSLFINNICAFAVSLKASLSQWTQISGDSSPNQQGVYGTKGVPSISNKPGSRSGSVSWTDNEGNLWLFGGIGYAGFPWGPFQKDNGFLNDLWKFDTATKEWTWVSGDNVYGQLGVYGDQGVSSASNKPGARAESVAWTDSNGNLWLFGGSGYAAVGEPGTDNGKGSLNDLWKFDTTIQEWTWVSGDTVVNQAGIYGTQGVAALGNKPSSRYYAMGWSDVTGALWLFGGATQGNGSGHMNDLWKFDRATNLWAWMSGDQIPDQLGVYGHRKVAEKSNKPGARSASVAWADKNGYFWLYGGEAFIPGVPPVAPSQFISLGDLWRFEPASGLWTWMSGTTDYNARDIYAVIIGSVQGATGWADSNNNLWLFGGYGFPDSDHPGRINNDLWTVTLFTGEWSVLYPNNTTPPPRRDAVSWTDKNGNFWLFGGSVSGFNYLNDLWVSTP